MPRPYSGPLTLGTSQGSCQGGAQGHLMLLHFRAAVWAVLWYHGIPPLCSQRCSAAPTARTTNPRAARHPYSEPKAVPDAGTQICVRQWLLSPGSWVALGR